jgi:methionine-S-sulfoxide reductase
MDREARGAARVPEKATFAGGCFWCMQPPFDGLRGVISTRVGYTGGHTPEPTYCDVCSGATGHAEAIEVVYDPRQISYEELLEMFWRNIDPTASDRQFCDAGTQYRTAIFYHSEEQRGLAQASKDALERSGKFSRPIVTEILPAATFYEAEDYHQAYYQKAPARYSMYKRGSGREDFLHRAWGAKAK